MTAIRQEILDYIDDIPDSKLEVLKPLLALLLDDMVIIETNLGHPQKPLNQHKHWTKQPFCGIIPFSTLM